MEVTKPMRTSALTLAAVLASVSPAAVSAASNRVATVEMDRVLRECEMYKDAEKRIQAQKNQYQQLIDGAVRAIERISERIESADSASTRRELEQEKREKTAAVQKAFNGYRKKLAELGDRERERITVQLRATLDRLAVEKGFELVVEKLTLYSCRGAVDITDELLQRVNEQ